MKWNDIRDFGNVSVKSWMRSAADSLFPRDCPVCGEIVTPRGQRICRGCLQKLDFVKGHTCARCGKEIPGGTRKLSGGADDLPDGTRKLSGGADGPSDGMRKLSGGAEDLCYDCRQMPKSFERGFALLNYDTVSQNCMVRIKYHHMKEDVQLYADLAAARLGGRLRALGADYLVPVPVHPSRQRERGYNQAEVLAEALSQRLGIPVGRDFLLRTRKTAAQKELNAEERFRNLQEAFAIGNICPDAQHILLVDDIYTTGATLEACTRILRSAGVKKVWCFCICIGREIY